MEAAAAVTHCPACVVHAGTHQVRMHSSNDHRLGARRLRSCRPHRRLRSRQRSNARSTAPIWTTAIPKDRAARLALLHRGFRSMISGVSKPTPARRAEPGGAGFGNCRRGKAADPAYDRRAFLYDECSNGARDAAEHHRAEPSRRCCGNTTSSRLAGRGASLFAVLEGVRSTPAAIQPPTMRRFPALSWLVNANDRLRHYRRLVDRPNHPGPNLEADRPQLPQRHAARPSRLRKQKQQPCRPYFPSSYLEYVGALFR